MNQILADSGFPHIDLLKVDIEGAETQLFADNLEWLEHTRMIAIEFHGDSREESGFDETMKRYRFRVIEANSHTTLAIRQ